ncbi:3',5'-cyclic-AMP phosphodiesterase [Lentibacillus sp. JNUCC-1]|uniref:metallophosphoesterase family protein n=1 Tax=Lentibacillus sp. JNUCC-1 TaxID=2654513 RepID=UPI0012E787F3|nr:metallophosphoesterase [Lentibacillus sp. JNUCC-1]MUV36989.1 3',5'-cyclic-AMP phosphodiesterase [Lentibacillus sp. JNUCC-1]
MTKFIYFTDTHIGANPVGFCQQPAYPQSINNLVTYLKNVVVSEQIDFVVHGGDLVQTCKKDLIQEAVKLMNFSVPVYLCLGNHDLDHKNAVNTWMENAPNLFCENKPAYSVIDKTSALHIIPNHWIDNHLYYWENKQNPYFTQAQIHYLEKKFQAHPDKKHILITHSPVFGMSKKQSGLDHVIHEPPLSFQDTILQTSLQYPELKLVLSGHNHLNTLKQRNGTLFVSGSSFIETPFEYKIIEVTERCINLRTHSIGQTALLDFVPSYNYEATYVQGREQDRHVTLNF